MVTEMENLRERVKMMYLGVVLFNRNRKNQKKKKRVGRELIITE